MHSGACERMLEGHENGVNSVAYSPDGKSLATGSTDRTIKLWFRDTANCVHTLCGHEDWVRSVAYAPNGKELVSGSADEVIRFWDAKTGECIRVIDDRVCAGLNITDTIGLTPGQRTALKLMGAIDHND